MPAANTPAMAKQDWSGRSRFRQIAWITLGLLVLGFILLHRPGQSPLQKSFSVFGAPGYVVPRSQISALQQSAPYLHVYKSLGGLPLTQGLRHPIGVGGQSNFIELLYGQAQGNYLDLAQSSLPLALGDKGTEQTVRGLAVREGVATLGGQERRFAEGKIGSGYFLLAGPVGGSNFPLALDQIAAAR